MTERQIPDRDPGLPPDPGPGSDPQIVGGTDPDESEPEGDREKAREATRNIDEATTQLPPD